VILPMPCKEKYINENEPRLSLMKRRREDVAVMSQKQRGSG